MAQIQGIDVSMFQPNDFHLLTGAGYSFAITKATEGGPDGAGHVYVDPTFAAKWAAIKAAGLNRGVYHFLRPDLGNSAIGEADAFLRTVGALLEPGDFVAVDVEKGNGDLSGYVQAWLDHVAAAIGFNPMLYANLNYLQAHGLENKPGLSKYGLWLADWGIPQSAIPTIPGWAFVAIWQTGSAVVPGFPSPVDHDIFFGTKDQLTKYGKPAPVQPPQPPQPYDPCQPVKDQLTAAQGALTASQANEATLQTRLTAALADNATVTAQLTMLQSKLGRANSVITSLQLAVHALLDYTP